MVSTREPGASRPPAFALIRGRSTCAWAVRDELTRDNAEELKAIVESEPLGRLDDPPVNAERYLSLFAGRVESGPAFTFPNSIGDVGAAAVVDDPSVLRGEFEDLVPEMEGRAPIAALLDEGRAVSVCLSARRSDEASEAGLRTLDAFRGRGYGPLVTTAWAIATRQSDRIPLYSTTWTNSASLSVAKKLGLSLYASDWSIWSDEG